MARAIQPWCGEQERMVNQTASTGSLSLAAPQELVVVLPGARLDGGERQHVDDVVH